MNTWVTLTDTLSTWVAHGKKLNSRTRPLRRRVAVFLAVVGPGLITSNVDNDAGGITTYTVAGAQFGYTAAVVVDSHDHRALRQRGDVRADGSGHR